MTTFAFKTTERRGLCRAAALLMIGSLALHGPAAARDGIPAGDTPTKTTTVGNIGFVDAGVVPADGADETVTGIVTWMDDQHRIVATSAVGTSNSAYWAKQLPSDVKSLVAQYHGDCRFGPSLATQPIPYGGQDGSPETGARRDRPGRSPRPNAPTSRAAQETAGLLVTATVDTIVDPIVFNAQVLVGPNPADTGYIRLSADGKVLGTPDVKNGSAQVIAPPLTFSEAGFKYVRATYYSNSANYNGSEYCLLVNVKP